MPRAGGAVSACLVPRRAAVRAGEKERSAVPLGPAPSPQLIYLAAAWNRDMPTGVSHVCFRKTKNKLAAAASQSSLQSPRRREQPAADPEEAPRLDTPPGILSLPQGPAPPIRCLSCCRRGLIPHSSRLPLMAVST